MKKIITALFIFFAIIPVVALTTFNTDAQAQSQTQTPPPSSTTQTQPTTRNCDGGFLGIPPWFRGLTNVDANGDCYVVAPGTPGANGVKLELTGFIWHIVLNIIQIGLTIGAYVAIAFIIFGGFLLMTGGANPGQTERGQKTILNAIIGLAITVSAIGVTNFAFDNLLGSVKNNAQGFPQMTGEQLLQNGLNIVYYLAGAIAIITIVVGGLNFVTANGDASKITKARGLVIYAAVGLAIILAAFAITNFILGRFT